MADSPYFKKDDDYLNYKADNSVYGSKKAKKLISQAPSAEKAGGSNMDKYAAAASMAGKITGVTGDPSGMNESDGAMSGAMSGVMTGSSFGPYGAAVCAVAGGIMGAAQSRAAAKAHNAKIEANKLKALGEIEEKKGLAVANILQTMGSNMGRSLR